MVKRDKNGTPIKRGSEDVYELRCKVIVVFTSMPTWYTPNLFVPDMILHKKLFPEPKNNIYQLIKRMSDESLQHIEDLYEQQGTDFNEAKRIVKHTLKKPLLNKIRDNPSRGMIGGWREPTYEELREDQKRRLTYAEKRHITLVKRDQLIEKIGKDVIEIKR